jgi:hypothetical protein
MFIISYFNDCIGYIAPYGVEQLIINTASKKSGSERQWRVLR